MRDSADVPARHQKMPSEHTTPMLQRSQAYRMVPDILPSKAGQAAAQQPRGGGEGAGQCSALLTRVSSPSQTCTAAAKHNHESILYLPAAAAVFRGRRREDVHMLRSARDLDEMRRVEEYSSTSEFAS